MATPREMYNQLLRDEIDAFAARMKQVIDDNEAQLKAFERVNAGLVKEIERLREDQQVSQ